MIVEHKFRNHLIDSSTEILIIGTFNPNVNGNNVTFYYGRPRNYLWKYLPLAFNEECLKGQNDVEKFNFMEAYKVDFIDLIKLIDIENGQELNFDDNYLDNVVEEWNDILLQIGRLKKLKKIIFTRSTFNGITNIYKKLLEIENYCDENEIEIIRMISPARFWRQDRQNIWNNFINN